MRGASVMAKATFDKLVGKYPPDVRRLALAARKVVLQFLPGADEVVADAAAVVGYGYGSGYKGVIFTLILSKPGVKLGVVRGAELSDPDGLLQGKGKTHRYVQLRTAADVRSPDLKRLMKAAKAAWEARAGAR